MNARGRDVEKRKSKKHSKAKNNALKVTINGQEETMYGQEDVKEGGEKTVTFSNWEETKRRSRRPPHPMKIRKKKISIGIMRRILRYLKMTRKSFRHTRRKNRPSFSEKSSRLLQLKSGHDNCRCGCFRHRARPCRLKYVGK